MDVEIGSRQQGASFVIHHSLFHILLFAILPSSLIQMRTPCGAASRRRNRDRVDSASLFS